MYTLPAIDTSVNIFAVFAVGMIIVSPACGVRFKFHVEFEVQSPLFVMRVIVVASERMDKRAEQIARIVKIFFINTD